MQDHILDLALLLVYVDVLFTSMLFLVFFNLWNCQSLAGSRGEGGQRLKVRAQKKKCKRMLEGEKYKSKKGQRDEYQILNHNDN